jgi:hypothetical protein
MKLSIVIPAHNESGSIEATVDALETALTAAGIAPEILIVEDHSTDGSALHSSVSRINSPRFDGFEMSDRPDTGMPSALASTPSLATRCASSWPMRPTIRPMS